MKLLSNTTGNNESVFQHKSLLTDKQFTVFRKDFKNHSLADGKVASLCEAFANYSLIKLIKNSSI